MTNLIVIAGPTATGKSDLALEVAKKLNGEIVSADSVQVYRHFDIGSAKPTKDACSEIKHHLIDICDPDENFTMWEFNIAARAAIEDITSRGKPPIVVGGTGLYIKALLENMDGGAISDPNLRRELLEEIQNGGVEVLYERLSKLNPEKAETIKPTDSHRIIRAVENELLPKSEVSAEEPASPLNPLFFVLNAKRELLYSRVNSRVKEMLKIGWIEEVESILKMEYDSSLKPFKSVGYRQILRYLEGKIGMEELLELIQTETRNYAKRQITWFNRVNGAIWINPFHAVKGDLRPVDYITGMFKKTQLAKDDATYKI